MFRKILKIMAIVFFWIPTIAFLLLCVVLATSNIFGVSILQGTGFLLFLVGCVSLILLGFVEED